jgi:magnesium chelatase subunit I
MSSEPSDSELQPKVRSLRELLDMVTGRSSSAETVHEDFGLAESLPFPFLALVGQYEMKLALMLAIINPACGGVLLIGPRGTGKTTAVRSLMDLLPLIERSTCFYGCTPEEIEADGIDAVCPDCAQKYGQGLPLTRKQSGRLIELPLNARLEDVIGGLDERALIHERMRLKRGILAQADQNILYSDEVNLLPNEIIDAILDAAAQWSYTVRRGPHSATYKSRFTLIGSMNPEEGSLRPQILDRFGLRIVVKGLEDPEERLLAYQRVKAYHANPRRLIADFSQETEFARNEIQAARDILPEVEIPPQVARTAIDWIRHLKIDSLRAEITLLEAARAFAASDGRRKVELNDLRAVSPMALRLRRSSYMIQYFSEREREEQDLMATINNLSSNSDKEPSHGET